MLTVEDIEGRPEGIAYAVSPHLKADIRELVRLVTEGDGDPLLGESEEGFRKNLAIKNAKRDEEREELFEGMNAIHAMLAKEGLWNG